MFVKILAGLLAAASVTLVGVYIAKGPTDSPALVQTASATSLSDDSESHSCCSALASRSQCMIESPICAEEAIVLSTTEVAASVGGGLLMVNTSAEVGVATD